MKGRLPLRSKKFNHNHYPLLKWRPFYLATERRKALWSIIPCFVGEACAACHQPSAARYLSSSASWESSLLYYKEKVQESLKNFFLVKWPAHELKKCVLYTRPQLDVAIKLSLVEIFAIPRSANRNVCQVISSLCNLWRGSICHKFTFQTSAGKVQHKSKKTNVKRKIM